MNNRTESLGEIIQWLRERGCDKTADWLERSDW
jgi:hypothetical protein